MGVRAVTAQEKYFEFRKSLKVWCMTDEQFGQLFLKSGHLVCISFYPLMHFSERTPKIILVPRYLSLLRFS